MERDFRRFMKCLEEAGRRIEGHYFQLDTAGSAKPISRERVYCYELYHQLRHVLGDSFPYKLDGEVDKAGHPIIRRALEAKKPDFIIHVPGEMKRNLLVIEVKPVSVKSELPRLKEDLNTLKGFLNEANYFRAIMLIYGDGKSDLPQKIRVEFDNLYREGMYKEDMLLVWHRGPRENQLSLINKASNIFLTGC